MKTSTKSACDIPDTGLEAPARMSPLRELRLPRGLAIMKNQVTAAEYMRCVAEAACPRVPLPEGSRDVPVVGVNWNDAAAYAAWISRKTGVTHRLPTDEEWSFAAAEKVRDEGQALVDPADPAQAWIARYDAEAARARPRGRRAPAGRRLRRQQQGSCRCRRKRLGVDADVLRAGLARPRD
ncbi:formylglycine-generating enzyme required for sulfatase activity [Bradyrhizobium sp. LB13.1]